MYRVSIELYKHSGSLGEREMLWEHNINQAESPREPQVAGSLPQRPIKHECSNLAC